ncbi:MAG: hypothetical protein IT210_14435 [Armatimonadetes bacterium]|nr:hypothetical protein [Armatimonadota bacterium]
MFSTGSMIAGLAAAVLGASGGPALDWERFRPYVEGFNRNDRETVVNAIDNASAWEWMKANIPFFECPEKEIEEIYYFRWWTYRKHIRQTPDGFVVTEFLPDVPWAKKYNTIDCPAGHHFREGRWIREPRYLDDYSPFWFRKGGDPLQYSFWAADSIYQRYLVTGGRDLTCGLLDDLVQNYGEWEKKHLLESGIFWQIDSHEGGEFSIGGNGCRPMINAYMYGDAGAIARIAALAGQEKTAREFRDKARRLKRLVQEKLWDKEARFFKTLRAEGTGGDYGNTAETDCKPGDLVDVREIFGYVPWYFHLPDRGKGYESAWKQLFDRQGFYAPYGPISAERRHRKFMSPHAHECLWNGPSWPFSTSQTLTALANLLSDYPQKVMAKKDYLELLHTYTRSHRLRLPDGSILPWIDENLHPDTGEWLARSILHKAGRPDRDRGKDYNHSTFCDLVITGLAGLRPRPDDIVEVNPLVPAGTWDYFCLDGIPYHGSTLTVLYDRTGGRYRRGKGLRVFAGSREIAASPKLGRGRGKLERP